VELFSDFASVFILVVVEFLVKVLSIELLVVISGSLLFEVIGEKSSSKITLVFSDVSLEALGSLEDIVSKFPAGSVGSCSEVVKMVLSVGLVQVPVSLEA
jgi:hypothetical protein